MWVACRLNRDSQGFRVLPGTEKPLSKTTGRLPVLTLMTCVDPSLLAARLVAITPLILSIALGSHLCREPKRLCFLCQDS